VSNLISLKKIVGERQCRENGINGDLVLSTLDNGINGDLVLSTLDNGILLKVRIANSVIS
jgi:hypothetical protein